MSRAAAGAAVDVGGGRLGDVLKSYAVAMDAVGEARYVDIIYSHDTDTAHLTRAPNFVGLLKMKRLGTSRSLSHSLLEHLSCTVTRAYS